MLDPKILRLVAITDDAEDGRATLTDRVAAAVRGGATSVQVRLKRATPREVVEITRSIISRVAVPVIVNDRADIALAAGAAGVHVGEADLPVVAIRRFAPANFIIGASLGSDAELANAKDADYVGIGPVYGSDSKSDAGSAIGVEGFKRLASLVAHPAVAVGGITADRALQITVAGAAGVALGIAVAWSPLAARALMPFLVFVNTLPKVAVAPLFLLWLGYGILPNMLIGALIGFFPVVINTAVGLTQVDPEMLDLGRVFSAPKWKVFVKIRIPNAYPYILSALKVTATAAVVGAIVGEFVASQRGLGYVIITSQGSMNTPVAFAALVWISAVGLALYGAVVLAARWIAPWAEAID